MSSCKTHRLLSSVHSCCLFTHIVAAVEVLVCERRGRCCCLSTDDISAFRVYDRPVEWFSFNYLPLSWQLWRAHDSCGLGYTVLQGCRHVSLTKMYLTFVSCVADQECPNNGCAEADSRSSYTQWCQSRHCSHGPLQQSGHPGRQRQGALHTHTTPSRALSQDAATGCLASYRLYDPYQICCLPVLPPCRPPWMQWCRKHSGGQ